MQVSDGWVKVLKLLVLTLLITLSSGVSTETTEHLCLAKAIYYEARGQSDKGQLAVGQVVLNRVESPKFPDTVCDVVYQKYQFSWTHMKLSSPRGPEWTKAKHFATTILEKGLDNFPALYFHNSSVSPGWKKKRITKIDNHIFYK